MYGQKLWSPFFGKWASRKMECWAFTRAACQLKVYTVPRKSAFVIELQIQIIELASIRLNRSSGAWVLLPATPLTSHVTLVTPHCLPGPVSHCIKGGQSYFWLLWRALTCEEEECCVRVILLLTIPADWLWVLIGYSWRFTNNISNFSFIRNEMVLGKILTISKFEGKPGMFLELPWLFTCSLAFLALQLLDSVAWQIAKGIRSQGIPEIGLLPGELSRSHEDLREHWFHKGRSGWL